MEKRIDKIIKKAECIYSVLTSQRKETNNLKSLISSLESYRDNFGDIIEKEYFFTLYEPERPSFGLEGCKKLPFRICDNICNTQTDYNEKSHSFHVISIPLVDFTEHIFDKMRTTGAHFIALPPMCKDENIADAVFDIQSYPVDDNSLLVAELYRAGFETKDSKVRFISDFD